MPTRYTRPPQRPQGASPLRHHPATSPLPKARVGLRTVAVNPEGGETHMPKFGNSTRTAAVLAAALLTAVVAAGAAASPARNSGTTITGAGSTFVAPLVS